MNVAQTSSLWPLVPMQVNKVTWHHQPRPKLQNWAEVQNRSHTINAHIDKQKSRAELSRDTTRIQEMEKWARTTIWSHGMATNDTNNNAAKLKPKPSLTFYPAFCFKASPTNFTWVKIGAADVHRLKRRVGFGGGPLSLFPSRFACRTYC